MQTVEQVISDLSRFSPNARVSPQVDVQGVSPSTECTISISEDDPLLKQIAALKDSEGELEDECEGYRKALSEIKDAAEYDAGEFDTKEELAKAILKIVEEA